MGGSTPSRQCPFLMPARTSPEEGTGGAGRGVGAWRESHFLGNETQPEPSELGVIHPSQPHFSGRETGLTRGSLPLGYLPLLGPRVLRKCKSDPTNGCSCLSGSPRLIAASHPLYEVMLLGKLSPLSAVSGEKPLSITPGQILDGHSRPPNSVLLLVGLEGRL